MQYEKIRGLSASQFRRLTGVKRCTFIKMVSILCEFNKVKRVKEGRKNAKAQRRGYAVDDIGVFAGISYLFSYRSKLWRE